MNKHLLVQLGYEYLNTDIGLVHFVENEKDNKFLNDLQNYPHAYVLSCSMDRQITAERAWVIPVKIKNILGDFSMETLSKISLEQYKNIFNQNNLHRFNDTMAEVFYLGVQLIKNKYNNDASNIWKDTPSSATVVLRFLEFKGCGIKIATMATNILARQFKIKFSDYYSIDVSPDIHVKRVMHRLGLISNRDDVNEIIYKAREMNPEFPGIIDSPLWEIGRTYCHETKPDCKNCVLKSVCKKDGK
jgi:endonuclease III